MTFVQPPFWAYERGGMRGWPQHVSLSVITPPAGFSLSLAEAKTQVKVDGTESDAELTDWIAAAQLDVEQYTRRACLTQAIDVRFDHFPFDQREIALPIAPLAGVTGIDYIDASGNPQTLDPSLYAVDAPLGEYAGLGRVMLAYGQFYWPFPPAMRVINGVTVHGIFGWGDATKTPATLKTAMRLLIGNWWLNREAGAIIRGSADTLPYGVDRMLDPFRPETLA